MPGEHIGNVHEDLQKTESAKLCSSIVKQLRPSANAMTWESQSKTCRAEFEATNTRIAQCLSCETCLFGKYISYV